MDLIYSKIKEALKALSDIKENEGCNNAKLLMCQVLILTDITFMSKEEVEHLKNIKSKKLF